MTSLDIVCIVSASAYAARRCKYSLFFNPLISKHPFEKAGSGRVVYTVGHETQHQTWLFVANMALRRTISKLPISFLRVIQ
jgi:hypothetical protein